jgi:hypothetical protein
MKEELQGKLVEILTSIQTAAGKASDFAMAELPDIAQSYIAYGRAAYTAAIVLAVVVLVAAVFAARLWAIEGAKSWSDRNEPKFMVGLFGTVGGVMLGLMVLAMNASSALLVWFAPKVWLLKEIAGMLK